MPLVLTSATFDPVGPYPERPALRGDPSMHRGMHSLVEVLQRTQGPTAQAARGVVVQPLQEVRWTVDRPLDLRSLAMRWGTRTKALRDLNPTLSLLAEDEALDPGTELVVFRHDPERPSRSIGAPNAGKLKEGVPMVEGSHWLLRERRVRSYGTRYMVEGLKAAFDAYAAAHPDGPPIRLGDLSARKGGHLSPHVSHRTGRDIDIGFVLDEGKRSDRYWERATEETFDVERNWTLIKALIDTGRVQTIFMSSRLQEALLPRARRDLTEREIQAYFRIANPDYNSHSIIRHWRGHVDHMHVRFKCEPGNWRCVSKSAVDE